MSSPQQLIASDGLVARPSGSWVRRKHHYLDRYCGITATGMKNKWPRRVYLDVMAGPGLCKIENTGEELPGSPLIALEHEFTDWLFIESDPVLADALSKRVGKVNPKARVIQGDWTTLVSKGQLDFPNALVVAFVDPTGIQQVPWDALQRLLKGNRTIDLLMTIQYAMGITLNANNYIESQQEQTAIDQFLGERQWRDWHCRNASDFKDQVLARFFQKMEALRFKGSRQQTVEADGRPLYRLALFSRHPKADEFWQKIITVDETGQKELL
jgi:three-Cys-motif partner protein